MFYPLPRVLFVKVSARALEGLGLLVSLSLSLHMTGLVAAEISGNVRKCPGAGLVEWLRFLYADCLLMVWSHDCLWPVATFVHGYVGSYIIVSDPLCG